MAASLAAIVAASFSGPLLTAPATCPDYPNAPAVTTSATQAMIAAPVSVPVQFAQLNSASAAQAAARISQIRGREGRAPPAYSL
ncbi:MAG: hypothetical protein ABSF17_05795 [Terracidiphilus sp.]